MLSMLAGPGRGRLSNTSKQPTSARAQGKVARQCQSHLVSVSLFALRDILSREEVEMPTPGDVVLCRQTGSQQYVVRGPNYDGIGWPLTGKVANGHGHARYVGRCAGAGDLILVTPAPTYVGGTLLRFRGGKATVLEDQGGNVVLQTPEKTYTTKRGGLRLGIPAGTVNMAKDVLVLELLKDNDVVH
jgi:hypothetical protein